VGTEQENDGEDVARLQFAPDPSSDFDSLEHEHDSVDDTISKVARNL
jgi:hypothetical protein